MSTVHFDTIASSSGTVLLCLFIHRLFITYSRSLRSGLAVIKVWTNCRVILTSLHNTSFLFVICYWIFVGMFSHNLSFYAPILNDVICYSAMSGGCARILPLLLSTGMLLYLIATIEAVPGPLDCRSVPLWSS